MSYAEGKYLQLLALDDIIDPSKIEYQVRFLETAGDRCAATYADARVVDKNGELLEESFLKRFNAPSPTPDGDIFEHLLAGNYIPIMIALFRTDAIRSVGGFNENLKFEDYDLWLRLAHSYKIAFQNTTNVSYLIHSTNTHTTYSLAWDSEYYKIYNLKFENYNLWIRLAKSYKIAFQDTTNVSYRLHNTNTHTSNSINGEFPRYGYRMTTRMCCAEKAGL